MAEVIMFTIFAIIIAIALGMVIYYKKKDKDMQTFTILALIGGFVILVTAILLFAPSGDGSSDEDSSFPWWIIFWVAIFPFLSKNQKTIDSKKKKYLMIVVGLTILIVIGTIILVLL
jgi:CDP-diglyceride synthetase